MDIFKAFGIYKEDRQLGFPGMESGVPASWEDAPNVRGYHALAEQGKRNMPTDPEYYAKLRQNLEGQVTQSIERTDAMGPWQFEIADRMNPDYTKDRTLNNEANDRRAMKDHERGKGYYHPFSRETMRRMYPEHYEE